jgi:hypothetical protein
MSSTFYKPEYRRRDGLRAYGSLGPPLYGPYQDYFDRTRGEWRNADGSKALAGFDGLGDMTLPELDLSPSAGGSAKSLMAAVATLGLGVAAVIGLGGWWLWTKNHRVAGGVALGVAGLAAVGGISTLVQGKMATDAAAAWRAA